MLRAETAEGAGSLEPSAAAATAGCLRPGWAWVQGITSTPDIGVACGVEQHACEVGGARRPEPDTSFRARSIW